MVTRICKFTVALLLSTLPLSGTVPAAEPADYQELRSVLESRFPGTRIDGITPSIIPGLLEVVAGESIVYSDAAGDHVLMGSLIETDTRRNLTKERLAEMQSIDFETLPFELAIKTVKGNGERSFALFADPDCPFCQDLEKSLEPVTDVTIYTFLYPLESLHPGATAKARQLWCSEDAATAWSEWMIHRQMPTPRECGEDPVDRLQELGKALKINSTPTMFFSNGRRVASALSTEQLEALLRIAATDTARAAAN